MERRYCGTQGSGGSGCCGGLPGSASDQGRGGRVSRRPICGGAGCGHGERVLTQQTEDVTIYLLN